MWHNKVVENDPTTSLSGYTILVASPSLRLGRNVSLQTCG